MPLVLGPLDEKDIEESLRIQSLAFYSDDGLGSLLARGPDLTESELHNGVEQRKQRLLDRDRVFLMQVTDTHLNQIIAVAHWEIDTQPRSQDQLDALMHVPPVPHGAHEQAWADFFGALGESRKTVPGLEPAAFLKSLCTHPDHHRRGAGAMLLKWGVNQADDVGVKCCLEASSLGKPLYERFGFLETSQINLPLNKYGKTGVDTHTIMVRPATNRMEL